jgi:hypothetical protein
VHRPVAERPPDRVPHEVTQAGVAPPSRAGAGAARPRAS